ncbi:brain-enriched guanylate kinase-associated protein-like [Muntiacus reevesi]|uniref:brain-enriched guanylate kinase-associated protein-like n=1 Tax=Muntiacus reevesi TaxID=9886 RepID=UPI0033077B7F
MEKLSSLQEQKGELRKRLSYTTHRLEKLENEFDSTRHFLEIELRRAQEELEKVTEKLRRSARPSGSARVAPCTRSCQTRI